MTNRASAIDSRTTRHPRLCRQSTEAQTGGRDLRLVEDGGIAAQGQAPGCAASRLAVHLRGSCLQLGADAHARGGRGMSRHGSAACAVAQSSPPRWDAVPAGRGVDGSCAVGWGAAVSFTPGFSTAY